MAESFELAAADVFEANAFGKTGRLFVEVDGDGVAAPDFFAGTPGEMDAILHGEAAHGDEGDDVGGADAGVFTAMGAEIDELEGDADGSDDGGGHGIGRAGEGEYAAIVVGIGLAAEQSDAGLAQGLFEGGEGGLLAAFAEVRDGLNEGEGHVAMGPSPAERAARICSRRSMAAWWAVLVATV